MESLIDVPLKTGSLRRNLVFSKAKEMAYTQGFHLRDEAKSPDISGADMEEGRDKKKTVVHWKNSDKSY